MKTCGTSITATVTVLLLWDNTIALLTLPWWGFSVKIQILYLKCLESYQDCSRCLLYGNKKSFDQRSICTAGCSRVGENFGLCVL